MGFGHPQRWFDDDFAADQPPAIPPAAEATAAERQTPALAALSFAESDPADGVAATYFGHGSMGSAGGLQRWEPGAAPGLAAAFKSAADLLNAIAPELDFGPYAAAGSPTPDAAPSLH